MNRRSVIELKTRIITGVIAALGAIGILVVIGLGYSNYLSLIVSVFSVIAVYEVMKVSKCKNNVLTGCAMAFSALVGPYVAFDAGSILPVPTAVLIAVYVMAMLIIMLKWYEKTRFEHVAFALFSSIAIPTSISCIFRIIKIGDSNPEVFQRSHIVFLLLCGMYAAWLCDTFAYFIGSKFGKRKLAPKISPKKSVEGAVAGVIGPVIVAIITYFICDHFFFHINTVNVFSVIIGMILMCIMGMLGDLSASVIKRNYGEKDFGSLFPGHGGVLDRIDSFLFTMPTLYILVEIFLAISK